MVQSTQNCVSRGRCWEKKELKDNILQCVKEATNEVDKNAVAVARTTSHSKEELVGNMQQKSPMIVSMFLSQPYCALDMGN